MQSQLFKLQDLKYRDFNAKLMPTIDSDTIIEVRTPQLRKFAKEFAPSTESEELMLQKVSPIIDISTLSLICV